MTNPPITTQLLGLLIISQPYSQGQPGRGIKLVIKNNLPRPRRQMPHKTYLNDTHGICTCIHFLLRSYRVVKMFLFFSSRQLFAYLSQIK